MIKFVFQGDSITDAGRDRDNIASFGVGYPNLVASELMCKYPGEYEFINEGVSGDRIPDVYARIVKDIIKVRPDYMSLLIGVNDVWRNLDSDGTGTGSARFEKVYNILLDELKEELPELKIIIMGPFLLHGSAGDNRPDEPDRFEKFSSGVAEMASISKKLAEKYGCAFIDLQAMFNEAVKTIPVTELTGDGVHPTAKGHQLIKKEWLKAFDQIKAGEIK